ncbi:MAG TPA: hypothetical protein PLI45_03470 [Candidatus Woesebacteria bacterium]|nr:hypothetical protein [Candidatus Woesebacteria bacterium]
MSHDGLLGVGDVITSKRFIYGHRGFTNTNHIYVGLESPSYIISIPLTEDDIVAEVLKTGKIPPGRMKNIDIGVPDPSRAFDKFVVIDAEMAGGNVDQGYSPGWLVTAKRLDKNGLWDPKGEIIVFFMTGDTDPLITSSEISLVGHMEMYFK